MSNKEKYKPESPLKHPADEVGMKRYIQWSKLPNKNTFEFELVGYYNANIWAYGNGGYIDIAAKSLNDYCEGFFEKDEVFLMQFCYKSFQYALLALPPSMKRQCLRSNMETDDNLYIKFTKLSDRKIDIHKIEKRGCVPDLKKQADELYEMK